MFVMLASVWTHIQISNPETLADLREELKEAKKVHLKDAITARKAINTLVKSVKETEAPGDPPFLEDLVYIPMCIKDPYCRLNRPFVVDVEDGNLGHTGSENDSDGNAPVVEDFEM